MEKVALFVDVQNIYYTVKQRYRCHFNYNRFWALATANRKVVKAIKGMSGRLNSNRFSATLALKLNLNRLFKEATVPQKVIGMWALRWI